MDIIIIGGGAAGMFCAMTAAGRGKRVLLLEHNPSLGAKLAISGGGRCNFTNRNVSPCNYFSFDPLFAAPALSRFKPKDFCRLLKKHDVSFEEEEGGKYFCRGKALCVVRMLEFQCKNAGASIMTDCKILSAVRRTGGGFSVSTSKGEFDCSKLVVATGGLSYPQIGASNFGFALAKQFGLRVTALRPALVSLLYPSEIAKHMSALSGVSVEGSVKIMGRDQIGGILFTHTGLSGPAILNSSLYWEKSSRITINLAPKAGVQKSLESLRRKDRKIFTHTALARLMPKRLAEQICTVTRIKKPIGECSSSEIALIHKAVHDWEFVPRDTAGFGKAEVTAGGIQTRELSSETMECKKIPGLYFVGELIDVTGEVGGYNLHWAWASAYAAGISL